MEMKAPIRKRSADEEARHFVWLEDPAIYVDTYAANLFKEDGIVRFAFGESLGPEFHPLWRVGLAMPIDEVRRLASRLRKLLRQYDAQEEDETTPAEENPSEQQAQEK